MANNVHVTLEGVPVEKVIDEALRAEYRSHRDEEVNNMARIVAMSRSNIINKIRNHSGSRSGRGRVIYSAALGGAL